jgi:hypothetical protein
MWPGQQPPGGDQNEQGGSNPYQQGAGNPYQQGAGNPYQQDGANPYQQPQPNTPSAPQPNPYQQPGYQQPGYGGPGYPQTGQQQPGAPAQPNQYAQQGQWGAPTPTGTPQPSGGSGWDRNTKITAIVAASAVVVTAAVTGFLVLGGDKDDTAGGDTSPSASSSASPSASESASTGAGASGDDNPRGGEGAQATVPGWKVVINPKYGTAFDVPPDWKVETSGTFIGFEDEGKGDGSALIGMSAPAFLQEKWCVSDDDHDGYEDTTSLAAAGTKGEDGAKDTDFIARNDSALWAFGGYTDQKDADKKLLVIGKPKAFKTSSGISGSVATSYTKGVPKAGKCDSDGKATTFGFKNSKGDFVSWTFYGAKGVTDEVPDATVQKILSTVRLHGDPTAG